MRGAGLVTVKYLGTEENTADIFTKILDRQPFEKHRKTVLNTAANDGVPSARDKKAMGAWPRRFCTVLRRTSKSRRLEGSVRPLVQRLPHSCEEISEARPSRERCCHHTERACDAPRLVRVDTAWCTPTSSMHNAACTIPVIECTQEPFECSVYSSHSNQHE